MILRLCFALVCALITARAGTGPELLDFDELEELAVTQSPGPPLSGRLERLLNTPFIDNQAWREGARPHRPERPGLGAVLRAGAWNIERGSEFELIRLALAGAGDFEGDTVREQLRVLAAVDVLILSEVDLGMKRTGYRDVTRELAAALRMNYAFGVEFVEVDGLDGDPERYRGVQGTAILSRYPIRGARILRLIPCYDWYRKEKEAIAELEKGRRAAANTIFLERISREVRHGGRMALIADIEVPESPTGLLTVVAPHLESRSPPECRGRQMEEVLKAITGVRNPVILGGDLNTSGTDAAPTSIRREVIRRVTKPAFWATEAIHWLTPVGVSRPLLVPANYFKNYLDPTAPHIPFFAPNGERGLFRAVEKFRFSDGRRFDFRGGRTLASSNKRALKGFRPTFAFQRDFGGMVGRFKLDWFFIKPAGALFAPHHPMTLAELNTSVKGGISDHHPITVDLTLEPPSPRAQPSVHTAARLPPPPP
jgi:endonuclease/exonuclease/phosphatase family metal-dependent hydrolase